MDFEANQITVMSFLEPLLGAHQSHKRLFTLAVDLSFIVAAFWGAVALISPITTALATPANWVVLAAVSLTSLAIFIRIGLYRAVLRYISSRAVGVVLSASLASTLSLYVFSHILPSTITWPSVLIYACYLLLGVGGSRVFIRALISAKQLQGVEPVIIYGAGSAGRQVATGLINSGEYHAAAFIDDDASLQGQMIMGINVYRRDQLPELIKSKGATKLLLAVPSATRAKRKQILSGLEPLSIKVLTIPCIADIVAGKHRIDELNEVDVADLLGRDAVDPVPELMQANIRDKVVLVTGAGGSIGAELCRQIIAQQPTQLILFEASEFNLYSIDKELNGIKKAQNLNCTITPVLGSVQNAERIGSVLHHFNVQTLYHAAAYKHVPLVEYNTIEGVENNVFGTLNTAQAAITHKVETFVLISTDKAVRPTNTMGASKRMSEMILQALAKHQKGTRFCMVRFGNVLGSSGSVVPLFRKQIASGGPITLTHYDITRYFMTIPEAAQLVIQAGAMGQGGDVFVLDMGEPVKIKDLATKMVHLSGLEVRDDANPYGDIEIQCTGLRPGEKLYEELLIGDNVQGTTHERIMTAQEQFLPYSQLRVTLEQLRLACNQFDCEQVRAILLAAPLEYQPQSNLVDLLWTSSKKYESNYVN